MTVHKGGYVQRHSDLLAIPFVAITIVVEDLGLISCGDNNVAAR
jgi:hypothetical protein